MLRRDSNPQSQQDSGRTPTPSTAQPLGLTHLAKDKASNQFLVKTAMNLQFAQNAKHFIDYLKKFQFVKKD